MSRHAEPITNDDGRVIGRRFRCDCGASVTAWRGDADCTCGRMFNMYGQRLAPRRMWGEA